MVNKDGKPDILAGGYQAGTRETVVDLDSGESWDVRAGSAGPIRWSADDSRLILGVYELQNGERPQIITVSAAPGGAAEQLLLDYAELIEVVEYPRLSAD